MTGLLCFTRYPRLHLNLQLRGRFSSAGAQTHFWCLTHASCYQTSNKALASCGLHLTSVIFAMQTRQLVCMLTIECKYHNCFFTSDSVPTTVSQCYHSQCRHCVSRLFSRAIMFRYFLFYLFWIPISLLVKWKYVQEIRAPSLFLEAKW